MSEHAAEHEQTGAGPVREAATTVAHGGLSSVGPSATGLALYLQRTIGNSAATEILIGRGITLPRRRALARQTKTKPHTRFLGAPPTVAQQSRWTCWAGALESWLTVVPGATPLGQQELIDAYATIQDKSSDQYGGLTPASGWPPIAAGLQIQYKVLQTTDKDEIAYLWRTVHAKLGQGYVLLVFTESGGAGHANVVYGIEELSTGKFELSVMDPAAGGSLTTKTLEFYQSHVPLIVGWPGEQFYLPPRGP